MIIARIILYLALVIVAQTNKLQCSLYWEGNILDLIQHFIPHNPIILEAGAHYGEDTKLMSHKWPKAQIYAFEPLPLSYRKLQQQTSSLSNVKCYPYALSNQVGKSLFYICNNGDGASSLLAPKPILDPYLIFNPQPIQVDCTTIDIWAHQNNIKKVDFMWLDMEGAELQALKAAPHILSTVKVIYTEVNFQEFRENNCFYHEIKDFLENNGFKEEWSNVNTSWQGNVLFIRK